jgi:phosphoglycerol transferase MdoB-like AlkP superfamily enzyme
LSSASKSIQSKSSPSTVQTPRESTSSGLPAWNGFSARLRFGALPTWIIVAAYLFLPALLSLLSGHLLSTLPHGYINLEFLLIGAVGFFLPRSAVFALLLIDALADCAYSICYTYQFSLHDLFESLRFMAALPASRRVAGCVVLLAVLLLCWALSAMRPPRRRRMRSAAALLIIAAALVPIDALSGQNPLWHQDVSYVSFRLTRSPILVLGVRQAAAQRTESTAQHAANQPLRSASAQMLAWLNQPAAQPAQPDVVLIVVESWGLPLDPRLAAALTASYADPAIARNYRVTAGTAPFTGLTVPGEARELCRSTLGFGILHPSSEEALHCLPDLLRARGYRATAIHGYAGEMFYRAAWYRELGFDRTFFGADLAKLGLPRCGGAFPGICDGAIARFIGRSLVAPRRTQPQFVYWVTLNSHLPVPVHPALAADSACASDAALQGSPALCSWFRLVRAVHQSVGQVAIGVAAHPTVFVLVGDHAPPFADPALRSRFSSAEVPYIMLTPLSAAPH